MKKTFLLLVALFATVGASAHPLYCGPRYYVDGYVGTNWMGAFKGDDAKLDFDTGCALGAAMGYRLTPFFSLEGEVSYRHNQIKDLEIAGFDVRSSGHFESVGVMLNGVVQAPICHGRLIPYAGVGIGNRWDELALRIAPIATNEGTIFFPRFIEEKCGAAYQAIVGTDFASWWNTRLGVEYRYQNRFTKDPGSHSVSLKLAAYY